MQSRRNGSLLIAGGIGLVFVVAIGGFVIFGGSPATTPGPGSSPSGVTQSSLAPLVASLDASGRPGTSPGAAPDSSGIAAAQASGSGNAAPASPTPTEAQPKTTVTPTVRVTPAPTPPPPSAPTPPPPPSAPCYVLPSSNVWNRPVTGLPVAGNSDAMVAAIGLNSVLHPDFDTVGDGIPYNVVTSATPTYTVAFDYADESDPGPYPIPSSPRIEGGSDAHLLAIDVNQCKLWELYAASHSGSGWSAGSGAVFDLRSNGLRPDGWTSADAAGLPIFPGLVRYEEVATGSIDHAIRFTAPHTCGYIYPARHLTAPPCGNLPPMGLRVRLKASVDISGFGPHAQIVLTALKRYGMILADNGSPWFISGTPDSRWNDDEMHQLQTLTGVDFEVVDTSGFVNG